MAVDYPNYDLRVGRGASDQFDLSSGDLLDLDYFTPAGGPATYNESLAESIAAGDALVSTATLLNALAESVALGDALSAGMLYTG